MTYEIEKNIPIARPRRCEFPLEQMEPGDSFLMPESKLNSLRWYMRFLPKEKRRQFTTRKVNQGIRVWRVA